MSREILGDQALLELIADVIRTSLEVHRGEVLTDEAIADRAGSAAMAVAHALDVAMNETTAPVVPGMTNGPKETT